MRVLDLFSGIGGFSLGLERAGMETVAFCEWDATARKVLKKHWPDVPCYEDVRDLTKERLDADGIGSIELICGGYPCQPFSTAGQRKGEADDRHLWPEVRRLIQEIRPTWVLCENVAGHISMGLDEVLADLESAGYHAQTLLIPACAVGACHRRDRVWIIAHAEELHDGQSISQSSKRPEPQPGERAVKNDVADPLRWRAEMGRNVAGMGRTGESIQGDFPRLTADQSYIRRKDDGLPGRLDRLKQLGNAVVPQVVEMIGRAIMEAHANG